MVGKPQLVLRVAVVGHRSLSCNGSELEACIHQVLGELRAALAMVQARAEGLYASDAPTIRLYTGLAEGADLRVAKVALAETGSLEIRGVLYVPPDEHARGLQDVDGMSRNEASATFAAVRASANALLIDIGAQQAAATSPWVAYEGVARILLDQADIVLAILDERHEPRLPGDVNGPVVLKRGGTRHTVERALGLDIGALWIDPSGTKPVFRGLLEQKGAEVELSPPAHLLAHLAGFMLAADPELAPTALRRAQRMVATYERETLPRKWRHRAFFWCAPWRALEVAVRDIVTRWPKQARLVAGYSSEDLRAHAGHGAGDVGARARRFSLIPVFVMVLLWRAVRFLAVEALGALTGRAAGQTAEPPSGPLEDFRRRLQAQYERADALSSFYMSVYRGTFISVQLLGVLAVLLGAAGSIYFEHAWVVWIELVVLLGIGALVLGEKVLRWRGKAIEYRVLAEQFRHARHVVPLGRTLPYSRPPAHGTRSVAEKGWMTRYFRAWLRAERPQTQARELSAAAFLDDLHRDLKEWVEGQRTWQARQAERYYLTRVLLGGLTVGLFALVLVAVVLHLVHAPAAAATHLSWTVFAVVVLPALIAAMHGILNQAEFEHLAERAASIALHLDKEGKALADAWRRIAPGGSGAGHAAPAAAPNASGPIVLTEATPACTPDVVVLGNHAVRIAAAMMEETLDWMSIYYRHETEPA